MPTAEPILTLLSDIDTTFPPTDKAWPTGLLAIGGDYSPARLLEAYSNGIFPWDEYWVEALQRECILWFSPSPRMVLPVGEFRLSQSLARTARSGKYETRLDTNFRAVIEACRNARRKGQDGTWISHDVVEAYTTLHQLGVAHSVETYRDGLLVGGLYGVQVGDVFCGESMFHMATDASKIALMRLMAYCATHGISLIDAQMETAHLASLGARPIDRSVYLRTLTAQLNPYANATTWAPHTAVLLIGGNQGNRYELLQQTLRRIGERIGIVRHTSSFYETAPWGFTSAQDFLNMAVVIDTDLSPTELLAASQSIELEMGRIRKDALPLSPLQPRTYSDRPMDIDLIFYDSTVLNTPQLTIPHPHLQQRQFVLQPLNEIIPDYIHPRLRLPVSKLCATCSDPTHVRQLSTPAQHQTKHTTTK